MKVLSLALLLGSLLPVAAQLTIPSDGTDGAFNPTANVEIDLSLAQSNVWTAPVPGPSMGFGTYDADKWAVVFKYSSVNIPAGVTVTFKNHPTHAPVVWLVQGNVTIDGVLNLDGEAAVSGVAALIPPEPGPGGFRGAASGPAGPGSGHGPGGGVQYGNANHVSSYGNPQIIPLIGGSGSGSHTSVSGSAGGGAILIAASDTIDIDGSITVRAGTVSAYYGSAGSIRLVADQVTGSGLLDASSQIAAANGRIRVETNMLSTGISLTPSTIGVSPGVSPTIFQAASDPTVRIVSIDGVPTPPDPTAPLVSSADVAIENNDPVVIVIETRNFATAGSVVSVRQAGKFGATFVTSASYSSGDSTMALWEATVTLAPGFATMQARATAP
ncbi:hypothetical protein [Haloferula sp.]|uniref:hypothetical protein n=1 Tax=Haloferula sp. TaxID=2497595 RepID=UPI00329EDA93